MEEEPFNAPPGTEEGNLIIATCKEIDFAASWTELEVVFSLVCFTVGGIFGCCVSGSSKICSDTVSAYWSEHNTMCFQCVCVCMCVCACVRRLPNRAADAVNPLKWRIMSLNVPLTFLQSAGQTHSSCLLHLRWQEVPAEKPLGANFWKPINLARLAFTSVRTSGCVWIERTEYVCVCVCGLVQCYRSWCLFIFEKRAFSVFQTSSSASF